MHCKNCKSEFNDNERFCSNCGAKYIHNRLSVGGLVKQLNQEFLNYDNKLFKTFRDLTVKPEVVIDGYISGIRKRYVDVISYMAIALTVLGIQIFLLRYFYTEHFTLQTKQVTLQLNEVKQPEASSFMKSMFDGFFDYFGVVTLIFVPIVALFSYLIFSITTKKHNYAEHIVSNTYITAHYSIFMFLISIPFLVFKIDISITFTFITFLCYFYIAYAYKRLYNVSVLGTIWRTILITLSYAFVASIITLFILFMIGIIIGYTKMQETLDISHVL